MKKLSAIIVSPKGLKGFTLEREYEDDEYYIYRKFHTTEKYNAGYELFERRINTQYNCESVPGSESFGVWAWQHRTFDEAYNKLKQLKNNNEKN